MSKYIDAEKLKSEIKLRREKLCERYLDVSEDANLEYDVLSEILNIIESHQQEQPDFPTTDEQIKEFLDTYPEIKVPEKYENPDWLFKIQEQAEVDLEKEINQLKTEAIGHGHTIDESKSVMRAFERIARRFYELGLNARKDERI